MLRYSKRPPPRDTNKPVTKAIAQQRRAEGRDQRFQSVISFYFVCMGLLLLGAVIAQTIATSAPRVGDQLTFNRALLGPGFIPASLEARPVTGPWSNPGTACKLTTHDMMASGGTITITALERGNAVLNWAGGKTDAQAPCPALASLLISDNALSTLRAAEHPHRPPMR